MENSPDTTPSEPNRPADRSHRLSNLRRSPEDRIIAGVAGGIGKAIGVDSLWIRLAFVGLVFFSGIGLLAYILGWLLIPEEENDRSLAAELADHIPGLGPRS